MIDLSEYAKRHEKLFPKADLLSQVYKLEEELQEVNEAISRDKFIKELADCLIVCWGLYRFVPLVAKTFYTRLNDICHSNGTCWDSVLEQAESKWKINEGRTWKFDGKVYKHVGKDGEE